MQSRSIPQPIRLELPFTIERTTVNAYLFVEPEPVLIDTGDSSPEVWEALTAGLAAHGLRPADLRKVIISHIHIDHFGQAARLAETSDAEFLVLDTGYSWLTDFRAQWLARTDYYRSVFLPGTAMPEPQRRQLAQYSAWVLANYRGVAPARTRCFHAGTQLELGGQSWTALHLPGHASTQSCLYAPASRAFVASDMLLQRTPTPVIEPPRANEARMPALPQFVASLQEVAQLDIAQVFPGHGAPFTDYQALIARQLARIDRRKAECLAHVRAGAHTIYELLLRMYPPSEFVNMAGLWMVLGYLDLLLAEGKVKVEVREGVWRYEELVRR